MKREFRAAIRGGILGGLVGLLVGWLFVVGTFGCSSTFVDLEGDAAPADPCDPSAMECLGRPGESRCCVDGENCAFWDEAGELVCASWAAGVSVALPTGATATCGPDGAAICVP